MPTVKLNNGIKIISHLGSETTCGFDISTDNVGDFKIRLTIVGSACQFNSPSIGKSVSFKKHSSAAFNVSLHHVSFKIEGPINSTEISTMKIEVIDQGSDPIEESYTLQIEP